MDSINILPPRKVFKMQQFLQLKEDVTRSGC